MYLGYEWAVGLCDALLSEAFLTSPLAPFFDPLFASSSISSSPLPLRPLSPVPVANADALGAALAGFEAAIASVEEFIRASASFQDSQEQVVGYRHMLRPLAKSRAVARVIRVRKRVPKPHAAPAAHDRLANGVMDSFPSIGAASSTPEMA